MEVHELVVAQWDDGTVITSVVRRVDGADTIHHFRVMRNGELVGEADTVRDAATLAGRRVPAGN